ncbi:MAG: Ig-like domain-containing protein [Ruminococcus sp.]|nr:Ig-like domain-containing protein [Ruminococcus sp.]
MKKIKSVICIAAMCCMLISSSAVSSQAKAAPSLNHKSKTLTVGNSVKLVVYNAGGKVKWSSNNSKIAKISSTSGKVNGKAKIKAVKSGKATITAKLKNGKKIKCKITVKQPAKKTTKKTTTSKVYSTGGSGATVYITNTGTKYHSSGCRTLRKSKYAVTLSYAKSSGYGPCGICHPIS